MYYNNSNRKLCEAYKTNMLQLDEQLEQELYEALTKRIYNSITPLIAITEDRIQKLKEYRVKLSKKQDHVKMFVDSFEAETKKVGEAILAAEDLREDLKELEELLKKLKIKTATVEDAKEDFKTISEIRLKLNDILVDSDDSDETKDGGVLGTLVKIVKSLSIFKKNKDAGTLKKAEDKIEKMKSSF